MLRPTTLIQRLHALEVGLGPQVRSMYDPLIRRHGCFPDRCRIDTTTPTSHRYSDAQRCALGIWLGRPAVQRYCALRCTVRVDKLDDGVVEVDNRVSKLRLHVLPLVTVGVEHLQAAEPIERDSDAAEVGVFT